MFFPHAEISYRFCFLCPRTLRFYPELPDPSGHDDHVNETLHNIIVRAFSLLQQHREHHFCFRWVCCDVCVGTGRVVSEIDIN